MKEIASALANVRKFVIIFDELFRGTNVKDAFDASLLIITSLSRIKNNLFFISTHILEVADILQESESIDFRCFESDLVDQKPVYDYKLKEGISRERVGMKILQEQNIPEILERVINQQTPN